MARDARVTCGGRAVYRDAQHNFHRGEDGPVCQHVDRKRRGAERARSRVSSRRPWNRCRACGNAAQRRTPDLSARTTTPAAAPPDIDSSSRVRGTRVGALPLGLRPGRGVGTLVHSSGSTVTPRALMSPRDVRDVFAQSTLVRVRSKCQLHTSVCAIFLLVIHATRRWRMTPSA